MNKTQAPIFTFYAVAIAFIFNCCTGLQAQSFVTNGSASNSGGGCYQLTPDQSAQAGTIFSALPINLNQPFSLTARYNFGCKDVNGADGIVFILATTNTALGTGGGQLGYQGITPSIAIEVDDYQNGNFGDPAEDHMAVISMGSVDHNAASNLSGPVTIPNVEDCGEHCFSVSWSPSTQTLSGVLDGNFVSYTGNIVANIFGGNPNVYYGFSSATGSLSNLHTVCVGPPQLIPMADVSICPGQSAQLQADPNGESWLWSANPSLSGFTISNPTATPLSTTTYNVTITYACGATLTDDVMVTVVPPPPATASNNGPVCVGETLQLNATGGVSYSWEGPLFFGSNQQSPSIPNIDLINAGTYTVTITDANGCTNTASTNVVVHQPPVVVIVPPPLPFCENAPVQTLQAIPTGGTWGGAANAQGQINPATLGPGSHQVTYTYTDANGCSATSTVFVEIAPLPNVQITPAGPFCNTDPVQTLTGSPSNGIWGGAANPLGQVNPSTLGPGTHLVTYQVITGFGCTSTDTLNLVVQSGTTVSIQLAGPFCPSLGPQTLTATPPGGTWGGAANAMGQVNPSVLGPGVHQVTYSYSAPGVCAGSATAIVTVLCQPNASISGNEIICEGETATLTGICGGTGANGAPCFNGPYTITYSINGAVQAPITVSSSPFSLPTGIPGQYVITNVTSGNGCSNTGTGSAQVTVAGAPEVENFDVTCDSTNTSYIVTFEITGGDPGSYSVTGAGTLATAPPYTFTSNPVASGSPYSFTVNDANDCDPTTLSGNFSCQCETEAGTMNLTPITVCLGETITATHNGNHVLDGNDNLVFVLHSSNGNSLGTVFATNTTPQFSLVPPMMPGVSYYISAVAGNDDGSGGVDLTDPCLSVSFGTPVIFRPLPTASIGSNTEICLGETATLTFALTGNAPFDVTYSNGSQNFTLNNIFNNHTIQVSPATTTTYSLISVDDNSNPACTTQGGNSATVTVWQPVTVNQAMEICEGESVQLGGASQTTGGTYTDTLATSHGCDSIVVTALTVHPLDSVFLNETSCNPAQVGVFTQNLTNQNGCDSTVVTTVVFSQTDTTLLNSTTCDPAQAGVFTSNFVTPEGCDSIVIETVALLPSDTTYLSDTSCDPAQTGVFTQNLTNQFGCDSIIVTTVIFSQTDTTLLASTTCDPMLAGVFTSSFVTPEGCDSIVIETVALLPSDTTYLSGSNCDPAQTGVFTQNLINQFGCDSTVITTVSYSLADTTLLASTTCDPALAGVFTQNLTNQNGCDSLVIETVTLLPSDTTLLTSTTCDPAAAGVFTQNLINQNGCDSTVITTVSLLSPNECGLQILLTGDTIPCPISAGNLMLEITQGQLPFTYAWQAVGGGATGNGSSSSLSIPIQNLPGGSYSVTVTSANGLTATATAQLVQMTPPQLDLAILSDFGGFGVSCAGAADGSISASATGGALPYTYFWPNGGQGQIQENLPAGSYSVTVTGAYFCTAAAQISLPEPPPLALTFAVSDLDCFGQNDGAIVAQPAGGTPPYQFSLNGEPWQDASTFPGLAAGTFEVSVQDANGCGVSEIIWINAPVPVSVELGDDQFIHFGENATLTALVNLPFDSLASVVWSPLDSSECPGCLTQPLAPVITTTFTVSITAENGCTASDQATVFVDRRKQVYVPNAFSPNDDGLNDEFMIFAKPNTVARVKSFLVFSRWGETVFQYYNFPPNDPAYGWNGRHRGEKMNPSVFVWFAEVEFLDGQTLLFEGDVTLVR